MGYTTDGYTHEEFLTLSKEQKAALAQVAIRLDLIRGDGGEVTEIMEKEDDEEITETFNILRPNDDGCVPNDECDNEDGLLGAIHKKFECVTGAAVEMANQALAIPSPFWVVIDPDYNGYTRCLVVDAMENKPVIYFQQTEKAWHVEYPTLAAIADEVIRQGNVLVTAWRAANPVIQTVH